MAALCSLYTDGCMQTVRYADSACMRGRMQCFYVWTAATVLFGQVFLTRTVHIIVLVPPPLPFDFAGIIFNVV